MNEDLYSGGWVTPNDGSRDRLCAAVERLCVEVSKLRRPSATFERVEEIMDEMDHCDLCRVGLDKPEKFSVMTYDGWQMTVTWNFCPVCGRSL